MNREEIDGLYRRLGPVIYRRCCRLLGDSEMARDATQEVFLRGLQRVAELRDDRSCLPWLYRVSTNYCLDRLRQRERTGTPAECADLPGVGGSGLEISIARQRLHMLLGRTDAQTQQIALLHYLDRMTQEEIAEVLGLSRRTVGKRLKRLRANAQAMEREELR